MSDDELMWALSNYRQAIRTLWGTFFSLSEKLATWDSRDALKAVKRILFHQMVVAQVDGLKGEEYDAEHPMSIGVAGIVEGCCPVLIAQPRPRDHNAYWDYPIASFAAGELDCRFIDFFDWDDVRSMDLQYYRVRIVRFERAPETVGRDALIEVRNARAFVTSKS